ncbi:serine/threonine-protein kinase OXI1-like [Magnolia sinica]|uniref:serine/threonine-protein kinase OXI1-like n=1 Tax=Magnolia sinica TaxID=86752 RepID=UPI00265805E1|nr:serine/threonine-protein kinase OXI1-like [Magnolia sinica]
MDDAEQSPPLDLRDLKALSVLGRGAKGIAFLVQTRSPSTETLALKAISKSKIEKKKSDDAYRRIWFERDVLKTLHHPLLPNLHGFLETEKIVGFVIQYCSGGNLSALRSKQTEKMFSDDIIRFYAAELVIALEYLHGLGIVYRDLKPENVLIQENGHLMLIDFDLSTKITVKSPENLPIHPKRSENRVEKAVPIKKNRFPLFYCCSSGIQEANPTVAPVRVGNNSVESANSGKSNSFVGTEDYVAPEIIQGNGHDFSVDWWSLGVLLYEMLYGQTPFRGCNRKETFYRILTKAPELVGEQTPLRDLIRRLLEKEPEKRISSDGIKAHEFFRGVDWETVPRISRPPYIPEWRADVEETEGILEIDMEKYAENVFGVTDDAEKDRSLEKSKSVWVDGLSHPPNTADFSIF